MTREEFDATPIQNLIEAAKRGSDYARRCAWVKIISAKKAFRKMSAVMTSAEKSQFWANINEWSNELGTVSR